MFIESRPADPAVHAAAIRIARRCRFTVQACLREEEWADADREFYLIARHEVETLLAGNNPRRTPEQPGPSG
jgi:hypothetical protein